MRTESLVLDYFYDSLPQRLYCSDDLRAGLIVRNKKHARRKKYIQSNSPFYTSWLVFDVDRPTATTDRQDLNVPTPTITATSERGHAHLFYRLETPVIKREYNLKARLGPIKYVAAVRNALTLKLKADQGYSCLVSKNPLNDFWKIMLWEEKPYTLGRLSEHLDLNHTRSASKMIIGEGRNCTLFEKTSKWAYTEFRKCNYNNGYFAKICSDFAYGYNNTFLSPLPSSEVRAIVKSVMKFLSKNMNDVGFRIWCSTRGKAGNAKSIQIRQATAKKQNADIIKYKMKHPETTYAELARIFNVSVGKISSIPELKTIYEYEPS